MGETFLLLGLLASCQEAEALVEQLRSDEFATRESAEHALVEQGREMIPVLRKFENDPEFEVRVRVRRSIEEIGRRERIRALLPPPTRVTLRLKDVPMSKAIESVFAPFGVKADTWTREIEKRLVCLELKDATLWQALDTFCQAGAVHVTGEGWSFRDGSVELPGRTITLGDVRVRAEMESVFSERVTLRVRGWLPPGNLPKAVGLEDMELLDDRGNRIEMESEHGNEVAFRRPAGPTTLTEWRVDLPKKLLQSTKTVRLRGSLVIHYPRDVERVDYPVKDFRGPVEAILGGITIILKSVTASDGEYGCEVGVRWPPGVPEQALRIWFETAEGRLYAECCAFTAGGNSGVSGTKCRRGKERVLPAKLVVARLIGNDPVRIPLDFKDLPGR